MYPLFAQDCPCFYPFPLLKIGHQTLYLICFDIPRTILAASNLFPFVSNLHFSYLVSSSRCLGTCPLVLTMPIIITNNGAARFLPLPWYFLHTNHFARPLAPLSQIFHKWFHWPCVEQARFHIYIYKHEQFLDLNTWTLASALLQLVEGPGSSLVTALLIHLLKQIIWQTTVTFCTWKLSLVDRAWFSLCTALALTY